MVGPRMEAMAERTNGRTDGQANERTFVFDGRMDVDEPMKERLTDGRMDGFVQVDRRFGGRTDGSDGHGDLRTNK